MSEDSRKNQQKGKNDPKEQRRRRGRHAAPVEKKVEKEPAATKVAAPPKPVYEPPPPEFYKNLKRETDEILKITEEANTKYKKKEIQSNWAKYEMPIESYEEIDEQENLGADYEALIQAPPTVGSHFQFKHEKSWDISTEPSPYDKYFEINTETLSFALSTIPFYERNSIDISFFNESDIRIMDHRATKFKEKYYNDKQFTTPESEAENNILNSLRSKPDDKVDLVELKYSEDGESEEDKIQCQFGLIKLEECKQEPVHIPSTELNVVKEIEINNTTEKLVFEELSKLTENKHKVMEPKTQASPTITNKMNNKTNEDFDEFVHIDNNDKPNVVPEVQSKSVDDVLTKTLTAKVPSPQKGPPKNPIIESPEDLEKWLDDFLDG